MVLLHNKDKKTFIATTLEELLNSCGSVYTRSKYIKYKTNVLKIRLGQIGKPCNIDNYYSPKISLFCSKIGFDEKRRGILPKCTRFFCKDHVGVKADISVGDSLEEKTNVVMIRTELGENLFKKSIELGFIQAKTITKKEIRNRQPYLWR